MYVSKVYEYAVDSYGDVRTLVRGLPYQCPDDWEEVLDSIDEDSNLYLIKEPDNPKDELAIAAYLDDRRIGYVAASDNGKIWLYMTDEKMPCHFIERFEASFKIAFENPRHLFEDIPFEEIYRDKFGFSEQHFPKFEIPFLYNPKDNRYIWFDDKTRIVDMEKGIPDFHRKLAARMIILVGRKNNLGEYCYYIPYLNRPVSDIYDSIIQGLIDKYGFVIALPDVPKLTHQGLILMDLHVTYLEKTNYKDFDLANQSELVFSLTNDYDVTSKMEADNQTFSRIDKKYNGNRDIEIDDEDLFIQEPQSTPSFSKSDYILKKGEVTITSIDKNTYTVIDKITTDLYSFVRQVLFPSMELFSYLKKHTPYYDQFYDYGEYETLIKVFVIKDLGRIYKGLNHSFNFDTTEGKPLFLYMDKEVGGTIDISYDMFAQTCDPHTQFEPAVKMRKVIEDLTKSFYEYDITLWTDTDFIIHSFLKDVDGQLAKRYMELMRRFASVVSNATDQSNVKDTNSLTKLAAKERDHNTYNPNSKTPTNSNGSSLSAVSDFFPVFGVTLGKTTWKQVEDLGYKVKLWEKGPSRNAKVSGVFFWDDEGVGVFTSLYWFYHYIDFPPLWKSKGFSWDNSYDEWIEVFKKMGFNISVTQKPGQGEFCGHKTLSAKFDALSTDGTLLFKMKFDNGEDGCYTSSPKTLDTFSVYYKESVEIQTKAECSETNEKTPVEQNLEEEYYTVTNSSEGGKQVSMGVIVPEEGDEDFDFCSYECRIRDNNQINIITEYMKRFEEGKESRPFLMIGRPCLGLDNTDIFYSLDGEIIFNFIFDDKIKRWIREAGFVLGKVKSYKQDAIFPEQLAITLSVSKRKGGETLFKEASEEAMDYIEEYCSSQANHDVEARIIDAVEKYMSGDSATSYKVVIIPQYGIGSCTTLDGEDIAIIVNNEIIELAEKNKGVFGYITKVDYDDDGDAWFTIRVSRSIPRLTLESLADSLENSSSAINDFFPIFGFTLGKTTWKQAEDMGHVVEIWKEGPRRYTDVGDIRFEDEKGEGVFTFLMWLQGNTDFPPLWKSKGFSWNLSYDEWTVVFKKLGFKVTESRLNEINSESASFEALSSDGALSFELEFVFGENDHYTSSPKTLDVIYVNYKGTVTVETNQVNSEADEKKPDKVDHDEKDSPEKNKQEAVFQHCIFDVLGVSLKDTPNSKWKYESWNIFGGGYETYIFSAPDGNTGKYQKCEAIVNRNRNNNYKFIGLNADIVLSLLYHYRRVFDSSYQFEQCKEEYCKILDDSIGSISITDTTPWLSIGRSDGYSIGGSKTAQYDVLLYTSLYNKEYIDKLVSQGELITIFKNDK